MCLPDVQVDKLKTLDIHWEALFKTAAPSLESQSPQHNSKVRAVLNRMALKAGEQYCLGKRDVLVWHLLRL